MGGNGGHAPAEAQPAHAGAAGGQTIIIAAPMTVSAGGGAAVARCACGCGQPTGQCGGGHVDHGPQPVTVKEHARMVRDALEALSDYWQEDRIKTQILAAQKAVMISKPIGTVGERAAERAGFFAMRPSAPRSSGGSLMRPNNRPKA